MVATIGGSDAIGGDSQHDFLNWPQKLYLY